MYIYKLHVINFAPNMNRSEVEFRKANKATVEEDRGTKSARVLALKTDVVNKIRTLILL